MPRNALLSGTAVPCERRNGQAWFTTVASLHRPPWPARGARRRRPCSSTADRVAARLAMFPGSCERKVRRGQRAGDRIVCKSIAALLVAAKGEDRNPTGARRWTAARSPGAKQVNQPIFLSRWKPLLTVNCKILSIVMSDFITQFNSVYETV